MSDIFKMLKLGIVLAIFASVACVCLAVVNIFTAPTIAAVQAAKAGSAMAVVFADADSFEELDPPVTLSGSVRVNAAYLAKKADETVGVVIDVTGPTYDEATMLIGIDINRTITGIEFLALSDTPGFGQKAAEPLFKDQFLGLNAQNELTAGVDFDGISGSTVTTTGVTAILNTAIAVGNDYLDAESN
ncbi:MAG: FMN-binding protein [Spirochaetales bacterium]